MTIRETKCPEWFAGDSQRILACNTNEGIGVLFDVLEMTIENCHDNQTCITEAESDYKEAVKIAIDSPTAAATPAPAPAAPEPAPTPIPEPAATESAAPAEPAPAPALLLPPVIAPQAPKPSAPLAAPSIIPPAAPPASAVERKTIGEVRTPRQEGEKSMGDLKMPTGFFLGAAYNAGYNSLEPHEIDGGYSLKPIAHEKMGLRLEAGYSFLKGILRPHIFGGYSYLNGKIRESEHPDADPNAEYSQSYLEATAEFFNIGLGVDGHIPIGTGEVSIPLGLRLTFAMPDSLDGDLGGVFSVPEGEAGDIRGKLLDNVEWWQSYVVTFKAGLSVLLLDNLELSFAYNLSYRNFEAINSTSGYELAVEGSRWSFLGGELGLRYGFWGL